MNSVSSVGPPHHQQLQIAECSNIMSPKSPSSLAQHVLQTTRAKLTRETSASDPKLFKLLVCANLADAIATKSTRENDARLITARTHDDHGWQNLSNGSESNSSQRASMPSLPSGKSELVRTRYRHTITSQRTVARPQASLYDRAAFRRSNKRESKHDDDCALKSDSDLTDCESAYSDEEENNRIRRYNQRLK